MLPFTRSLVGLDRPEVDRQRTYIDRVYVLLLSTLVVVAFVALRTRARVRSLARLLQRPFARAGRVELRTGAAGACAGEPARVH